MIDVIARPRGTIVMARAPIHGGRMTVTRTAQDERGSHQHTFRRVRMPPNFFAIAFGLAGRRA